MAIGAVVSAVLYRWYKKRQEQRLINNLVAELQNIRNESASQADYEQQRNELLHNVNRDIINKVLPQIEEVLANPEPIF